MPITADYPNGTVLDGQTWDEFVEALFECEYCCECGGDAEHHEPWIVLGHWFAHCKHPADDTSDEYHPTIQAFRRANA